MPKIFISYRRDDSAAHAGRIYDRLEGHFGQGQVFMDVDAIRPGLNYVEVVEQAVSVCDGLVAVIGREWLLAADAAGVRRLEDPADLVRLEIATALERGIFVIPVLVQGARMPQAVDLPEDLKELAHRNALEVSDARFRSDVERLIEVWMEEASSAGDPMGTQDRSTHMLPVQLTSLVGRALELAGIADLLAQPDCRLLTLVGPGGNGKTRLAIATAETLGDAYRDGATFVSLVGAIPAREKQASDLLIANVANALRYTFSAQQPPRDLLLNYLKDKELLLVLDNFEQLTQAAVLLPDILQHAPGVKLLVTSRERLNVAAEWLFEVEGLPVVSPKEQNRDKGNPALELFVQSARRVKRDFNPADEEEAINRVCQLVDGSPLGIELAANLVRAIPCVEIAKSLEGSLDVLSTTSSAVAERHQSMRVVLDNSWDLLSDDEQQAFRRLSVFHGGFDLAGATEVTGVTLPSLARLVDKALLRRDQGGRYRMHELVRQYAAEQLGGNTAEAKTTRDRHSSYYSAFLLARKTAFQDGVDESALAEIDEEVENVRATWEWLVADAEEGTIADYLDGLWLYYQHKGWYQEAVIVLNRACELEGTSQLHRARWQRWVGEAYYQMGHMEESQGPCEQALALLGKSLPRTPVGWTLFLVLQLLRQLLHRLWPAAFVGRSPDKYDLLLESTGACRRLGQLYYLGQRKLQLVALSLYHLNSAERAGIPSESAVGYAFLSLTSGSVPLHRLARFYGRLTQGAVQGTNDLSFSLKAYIFEVIGLYNLGLGHWSEARDSLKQAATLFEQVRLPRNQEESAALLAIMAFHQGRLAESTALWNEVLASARYRGDPVPQFWCLTGLAENVLRLGDPEADGALSLLENAQTLPDTQLAHAEYIRLYGALGRAHLYREQPQLALQAAKTAARLIQQCPLTVVYAMEGYTGVAEVNLALCENGAADTPDELLSLRKSARQACKALTAFARVYPIGQPRAWLFQGMYYWLAGKQSKAKKAWRKSLEAATELGMPYEQGRAHYEIGRHLPDQTSADGDRERQAHLRQAREIFVELDAVNDLTKADAALEVGP